MLHELLATHPEIYMSPNKEPWFYALEGNQSSFTGPGDGQGVRVREAYREIFSDAGDERVVGESSTLYLASHRAPKAVAADVPEAKIVAVLRNPVDRAFSNYNQHLWQLREDLEFEDALAQGPRRVADGWAPFWDYAAMSRYGEQLNRWYECFPSDQIKVVVFDDLISSRGVVLGELYSFLGVSAASLVDEGPVNSAGQPKSAALHAFLRSSSPIKAALRGLVPDRMRAPLRAAIDRRNTSPPEGPPAVVAKQLAEDFKDQLEQTERLTGLSLARWTSSS